MIGESWTGKDLDGSGRGQLRYYHCIRVDGRSKNTKKKPSVIVGYLRAKI
jgi:hypothetical protein